MESKNKKRLGFTLIELLVVVLIIGILSSIALPKYQKAVKKSRAAGVYSQLSPMRQAIMAYNLAYPGSTPSVSDLDVQAPTAKFADFSSCSWQVSKEYAAMQCSGGGKNASFVMKTDGTRLCCSSSGSCNDYGFGTDYGDPGYGFGNCYSTGGYAAY